MFPIILFNARVSCNIYDHRSIINCTFLHWQPEIQTETNPAQAFQSNHFFGENMQLEY